MRLKKEKLMQQIASAVLENKAAVFPGVTALPTLDSSSIFVENYAEYGILHKQTIRDLINLGTVKDLAGVKILLDELSSQTRFFTANDPVVNSEGKSIKPFFWLKDTGIYRTDVLVFDGLSEIVDRYQAGILSFEMSFSQLYDEVMPDNSESTNQCSTTSKT